MTNVELKWQKYRAVLLSKDMPIDVVDNFCSRIFFTGALAGLLHAKDGEIEEFKAVIFNLFNTITKEKEVLEILPQVRSVN